MNTLNFLDANIWLALLWNRHVHSETARKWFEASHEQEFFFCRFTQLTVLRLLTTVKLMGADVRTMSAAWRLWDELEADDRIGFLPEPLNFEPAFRKQSRLSSASPKVWADAYLLAFASTAGVKLVTFDQALASRADDILVLQ
jgi:hypothetical protein